MIQGIAKFDSSHPRHLLLQWAMCTLVLLATACASSISHRQRATQLAEQGDYSASTEAYWSHIQSRLNRKDRPKWENPYIYLLDIGDNYLAQGNAKEALAHYLLADQQEVNSGFINDRLRRIAEWYEAEGQLLEAMEHLRRYRARDELLFDMNLDRLSRKLVNSGEF